MAHSSHRTCLGAKPHIDMIGNSEAMASLRRELHCVARSDAKVLITGESGVGKEIVARAIHAASPRSAQAFVPVNCAGIAETILESELFGHVRGSFTDAYRDKLGKFETAARGTIFLDEVGEMSPRMQGLLLRFLETGEIQKVGAERSSAAVDVRVIAATNADLRCLIARGQFREDLYYRLNVIHLCVPPLRERKDDIPLLLEHFLRRYTAGIPGGTSNRHENGGIDVQDRRHLVREISPEAIAALREYAWPGNVRELENLIERLVATTRREVVQVEDLGLEIRARLVVDTQREDHPRAVADELFRKLIEDGDSFWSTVYPRYMNREITRRTVRDLIQKGLEASRGNYRVVVRLFNMEQRDYGRFLNFLRTHACQIPFKPYRSDAVLLHRGARGSGAIERAGACDSGTRPAR